jgi:hypothetical protein
MLSPSAEARRAAEKAEADKIRAADEAAKAAFEAVTELLTGRAWIAITPPNASAMWWSISILRKAN